MGRKALCAILSVTEWVGDIPSVFIPAAKLAMWGGRNCETMGRFCFVEWVVHMGCC